MDSDEEYDRRRGRDKFRRERNDYDRRGEDRRRDGWDDRPMRRESWGRGHHDGGGRREPYNSREDYRMRRDRYDSPPPRGGRDFSPPPKRMRRDWDDDGGNGERGGGYRGARGGGGHFGGDRGGFEPRGGGHDSGGHWSEPREPPVGGLGGPGGQQQPEPDFPTQPMMSSFKAFLSEQDDQISDNEAVKKYAEYKMDFKKIQINEFFVKHKDEEWFKSKYHPEECDRNRDEAMDARRKRLAAFMTMYARYPASLDYDMTDKIVKFLDAVVIKLEGGTELDLQILDHPELAFEPEQKPEKPPVQEPAAPGTTDPPTPPQAEAAKKPRKKSKSLSEEQQIAANANFGIATLLQQSVQGGGDKDDTDEGEAPPGTEEEPFELKKKKKKKDLKKEASEEVTEEGPLKLKIDAEQEELKKKAIEFSQQKDSEHTNGEKKDTKTKGKRRGKAEYSYDSGSDTEESDSEPAPPGCEEPLPPGMEDVTDGGERPAPGTPPGVPPAGEKQDEKEELEDGEEKEKDTKEGEDEDGEKTECEEEAVEKPVRPRPLHKTCSIFLRNLAPSITKQEVEAMCRRYPGFMRAALQDPQPERNFFRRGWVTFDRSVNIKDICWNLNNIRLRDCEMGPTVNRELKQRVRAVNGITAHKQVVKADIKNSAKIITNLDMMWKLWEDEEKHDTNKMTYGLISKNPVLKNITDFLVEEGSYEEEELLGQAIDDKSNEESEEFMLERDEQLLRVLDRMILYLRVVHSMDYYGGNEYPNEDEMPNRCGMIHARGSPPQSRIMPDDISNWNKTTENKLAPFLNLKDKLDNNEAVRLGLKDKENEVEKFLVANTQELAKDKWLCPLSGKKFKGPEFVRKHILTKHNEKLDEVKEEVDYFNNYLGDPKRPQLPEHPRNRATSSSAPLGGHGRGDFGPGGGYNPHQQQRSGYVYQSNKGPGYQPNYNRGGDNSYRGRGGMHRRENTFPQRNSDESEDTMSYEAYVAWWAQKHANSTGSQSSAETDVKVEKAES
ncbi:serrate RNA effector molecule homolog isoform X2 [Lineus longissimus]|uniref:serrate RNA effector molecule homolog isoform X2 n=1 Tax=Lineus longissimus TaxID=88925 RepID=UPI00315C715B